MGLWWWFTALVAGFLWLGCRGVWVLFVNSIVCLFVFLCLFFVFECFWLGLLTGFSGWFFWALTFLFLFGEFDPGSGRTLAACLTHASRTLKLSFCWVDEWRTGE